MRALATTGSGVPSLSLSARSLLPSGINQPRLGQKAAHGDKLCRWRSPKIDLAFARAFRQGRTAHSDTGGPIEVGALGASLSVSFHWLLRSGWDNRMVRRLYHPPAAVADHRDPPAQGRSAPHGRQSPSNTAWRNQQSALFPAVAAVRTRMVVIRFVGFIWLPGRYPKHVLRAEAETFGPPSNRTAPDGEGGSSARSSNRAYRLWHGYTIAGWLRCA